jgi:hypothetical protein
MANIRHTRAFARALALSDTAPLEGDVSPSSPRSPPLGLDRENSGKSQHRWQQGADFGDSQGGLGDHERLGRVEKLTATSDFAVSG